MSRPRRLAFPGALSQVTSRGNAHLAIDQDDADRHRFLPLLQDVVTRSHWLFQAYGLLHNPSHRRIETPEGHLSAGMRQLHGVDTQGCNRRYGTDGQVFQGWIAKVEKEPSVYELPSPEVVR